MEAYLFHGLWVVEEGDLSLSDPEPAESGIGYIIPDSGILGDSMPRPEDGLFAEQLDEPQLSQQLVLEVSAERPADLEDDGNDDDDLLSDWEND